MSEFRIEGLIWELIDEKTAHESARIPLDRTKAVDRAIEWLQEHDPKGEHREYVVEELRRMTGPDRVPEADYYLEEALLQRLEAEEWGQRFLG